MFLAVDVGNTNTVLGVFQKIDGKSKLWKTMRVSTHPLPTADEFRAKLHWFFQIENLNLKEFEAVIVSSVVPSYTEMLRKAFLAPEHCKRLEVLDSRSPFSFTIRANPAAQVGADRLVNAEAALREYGAPCIIIDSGTATTLCAISADKAYLGGAIMPGLELSVDALAKKAAQLFTVELVAPQKVIGTNTAEALRSGIMHGYASMIDGMVQKFRKELGDDSIKVIGTGGISARLKPLAKSIDIFDPDLTLKGIAYLYETLSG